MASSDKPDFIEIDQKDAPLKLTEEGLFGEGEVPEETSPSGAGTACSSGASRSDNAAPRPDSTSPVSQSHSVNPEPVFQAEVSARPKPNDDTIALIKKSMPPGKEMRKLPGGSAFFVGLLVLFCFFGNSLDEMRNRTLVELAKGFAVADRGYVETVGDLGQSLQSHNNVEGAKAAYEKALFDLSSCGQDSGAKGAFVRLKLAEIAFAQANQESRIGRETRGRKAKQKHFDKSYAYQAEAKPLANKALEMLRNDRSGKPSELPFLLWYVADGFEDWYDYDMAVKLNEEALNIWGKGSPNRRSYVNAQLGYEYLRQGNATVAEGVIKQALNFSLKRGVNHENAWRFSLLGRAQIDLKKYTDAQVNISRGLEMWQDLKKEGKGYDVDINLARAYTDEGRLKAGLGNTRDALSSFQKSEAILKEHPNRTYDNMRNELEMANLYRDTGQFSKARDLYGGILSRLNRADDPVDRRLVMREVDLFRRLSGGL